MKRHLLTIGIIVVLLVQLPFSFGARTVLFSDAFDSQSSDFATWASCGAGICATGGNLDIDGTGGQYNLSKQSNLDLSSCTTGTARINFTGITEAGNIEPIDCLYVYFSSNSGSTYGDKTQVFCDDSPAAENGIDFPDSYEVSTMRWRYAGEGFDEGGESGGAGYVEVVCDIPQVPSWSVNLADDPAIVYAGNGTGKTITYTGTGTDVDGDQYRLSVCRTNSITDAYPGLCAASQGICNSTATNSGSEASCTYVVDTSDAGTLTAYGFLCDSTGTCNSTSTSSSTTVYQLGMINVSLILPPNPTQVAQNATFSINATVRCLGGTNVWCGYIDATARYNWTAATPNTLINTTVSDVPLHTVGANLQTSPEFTPSSSEWNVSWNVNYTGVLDSSFMVDVNFSINDGSGSLTNNTEDALVYNTTYVSSCYPEAGKNWVIDATDACVIDTQTYSVKNITFNGSGTVTFRNVNISSTGCSITPTVGESILLVIEPTTRWENAC